MVDLRSDTVTRPSEAMRAAMAAAEVGDDVFGEDPSVNRLQARAAEMMGKEAALFVPSGTMANLIAFMAQTAPGDSVIMSEESHPIHYEGANMARIGGIMPVTTPDPMGRLQPEQIAAKINLEADPHVSKTTLVAIENTSNRGGGAYYTFDEVEAIGRLCHEKGLRLHCDGARIFNAAAAANTLPEYLAAACDTVSFCLSKGLGAPAGSLICGTKETIHRALYLRKMLGGGMRQAGILAAAGLHALEHHVDDLRKDHQRAAHFKTRLEAVGFRCPLPAPTNIVYITMRDPGAAADRLREKGVLVLPHGPDRIRAVFHRDLSDADVDAARNVFEQLAEKTS
jgi:threonine aldolase